MRVDKMIVETFLIIAIVARPHSFATTQSNIDNTTNTETTNAWSATTANVSAFTPESITYFSNTSAWMQNETSTEIQTAVALSTVVTNTMSETPTTFSFNNETTVHFQNTTEQTFFSTQEMQTPLTDAANKTTDINSTEFESTQSELPSVTSDTSPTTTQTITSPGASNTSTNAVSEAPTTFSFINETITETQTMPELTSFSTQGPSTAFDSANETRDVYSTESESASLSSNNTSPTATQAIESPIATTQSAAMTQETSNALTTAATTVTASHNSTTAGITDTITIDATISDSTTTTTPPIAYISTIFNSATTAVTDITTPTSTTASTFPITPDASSISINTSATSTADAATLTSEPTPTSTGTTQSSNAPTTNSGPTADTNGDNTSAAPSTPIPPIATSAATTTLTPSTSTLSTSTPSTSTPSTSQTSATSASTPTTPRDPCSPNPCRNGGNCTRNGSQAYNCLCIAGFTGNECEFEINECEEFPCESFGKCNDFLNDFNCTCYSGYTQNTTKDCTANDYCEPDSCMNGGTCINQPQLARFYCECPQSNKTNEAIVGLRCENRTTTYPTPMAISPRSSIIAGGAHVTIIGQSMNLFAPLGAYFIPPNNTNLTTLHALVNPNATSSDSITVISPRASNSYVNSTLHVILEYSGPVNLTNATILLFTYQGNPVISDINPKDPLATGGVQLTVTGQNMNTVQYPIMNVTTVVYNDTLNQTSSSTLSELCSPKSTTEMTCLFPPGAVPPAFIEVDSVKKVIASQIDELLWPQMNHRGNRRMKRSPVANFSIANSTCDIYIGFVLDELPTYENISKSVPHITFSVTTTLPIIETTKGVQEYNPDTDGLISIKGQHLLTGCSIEDYVVAIGNETCVVYNRTDNELRCLPPKQAPSAGNHRIYCQDHEGTLAVMVYISTQVSFAYCLRYSKTDETNEALIIGLSVAAAVLLVLAIICLLVAISVVKKRKKEKERRRQKVLDYDKISTEGESSGTQHPMEVLKDEGSRKDIEVHELLTNSEYLMAIENSASDSNWASRGSSSGYLVLTPSYETDGKTFGATTSDSDSFGHFPEHQPWEQIDEAGVDNYQYEPDDPALNFRLTHLSFQEGVFEIPRQKIGGGDKQPE